MTNILMKVEHLGKQFPLIKGIWESLVHMGEIKHVHAVDDVSFEVRRRETFGLAGETGSGKSTIAKLVLKLMKPTSGSVFFEGRDIWDMNKEEEKRFRRDTQMIFQDPFASLNPHKSIFDIVSSPLKAQKWGSVSQRRKRVAKILSKVGLTPPEGVMEKSPHEFSGGQRQRIGIARALISTPKFIVADEPVSSLDVSIQTQVLNLINNLKQEFDSTLLLITHDLAIIKQMSDTAAIIYLGKLCELSTGEDLFKSPLHPYTKALIASVPVPDPDFRRETIGIRGEISSSINVPRGCRFHPRCPFANEICRKDIPKMRELSNGHFVACHLY